MAELSAGTVLNNRYELEKMIGRGGFAVVWLARDQQADNEHMALKVYAPDKGLDDSSMELFEQEYQLAQQLRDSRLLRATDYFHYGASPVLAFPYCSHGSALHYLQRNGPLPEEELARLIYQIGGALAYLHSRRPPVLHLDLKPDNILLSSSGDYLLADFGVSVRLQSSLLRGSNMKGATLDYLAPEHWSSGELEAHADIFSMGVMLWELTTGRPPFPGQGGQYLLMGLPVPDIPTQKGYTKRLNRLVHRCLSADPEDRPSAKDLETWADSFLEDGYWPGALSSGGGASPDPREESKQKTAPIGGKEASRKDAGQATHELGKDKPSNADPHGEYPRGASPASAQKDDESRNRSSRFIPLIIAFLFFAGLGVTFFSMGGYDYLVSDQQDSEKENQENNKGSSNKPDLKVGASKLFNAFDNNEGKADDKYKGKTIAVTGEIDNIDKNTKDQVYVTLKTGKPMNSIQCYFDEENQKQAMNLSKGQEATIKGTCNGKLVTNVALENSRVVKSSGNDEGDSGGSGSGGPKQGGGQQQEDEAEQGPPPLEERYDEVGSLVNGRRKVRQGNRWGYVNRNDREVISPRFKEADNFVADGRAWVKDEDENGFYINKQGNCVQYCP